MISRTRGLRSMSMTFLSSSAVHLNPFCISIYQYIQVCTGTYVYIWVRTSTYWYVLVCTCVQKRSCRARAHLGWTFSASWHWFFSLLAQEAVPEALSTTGTFLSDGPGSIAWLLCKPRKPISQWFQNLLYDESTYQYIPVCTSMYWLVIYWYILVYTCMYQYVPVWTSMYGYIQVCTGTC